MIREVDIDLISDGQRYTSNDMVKISCNDCNGCSTCCHDVGNTIILDPYDIYNLQKATEKSFQELLQAGLIALNVIDGLILPNINMESTEKGCPFLNNEERCSIHTLRPGFCRLYPMGRIYENDSFSYFHQVDECTYPNKSKVKLKNWFGIPNLKDYEKFILDYHNICRKLQDKFGSDNEDTLKSINMLFLNLLFIKEYDLSMDFYEQYYERTESISDLIK